MSGSGLASQARCGAPSTRPWVLLLCDAGLQLLITVSAIAVRSCFAMCGRSLLNKKLDVQYCDVHGMPGTASSFRGYV
jgi:hypothetical protein